MIVEPWLEPHAWIDDHVGVDIHEQRGVKVVRMSRGERNGTVATVTMHHLVARPGHAVEHFTEEHATAPYTVDQHMEAFAAAGLGAERLPHEGGLGRGLYVATAA